MKKYILYALQIALAMATVTVATVITATVVILAVDLVKYQTFNPWLTALLLVLYGAIVVNAWSITFAMCIKAHEALIELER